jgi:DNA mismatch repair protein MutL
MDPNQKGFAYQQVKAALAEDPQAPVMAEYPAASAAPTLIAPVLRAAGVLQIHNSYLVTQDDQGLLIVDQHALHERVMFEELYQRLSGPDRKLESQRLLMPAIIDATAKRQALLEDLAPLLDRLGIEAAPMGPATIGIQAFPSLLFDRGVEPGPFVSELLDRTEENEFDLNNPTNQEAALHKVLDMMACKAAVKAGDRMKPEELAALLARRSEIERSSNCPHGRPTTIRMTLRDLEKQFKRV